MSERPPLTTAPNSDLAPFKALLLVIAGIILGQAILYGPSLLGKKILLPLDILSMPNVYTPTSADASPTVIENPFLSDLIYGEPFREFCVSELKAGRPVLWNPYQYGGS